MHIGLIGGIGPAATDYYYRRLIAIAAAARAPLELTIAHADASTLVDNLARNDKSAQAGIFTRLTHRLKSAGAQAVAVTSVGGHFCAEEFRQASPLPVIDLLLAVRLSVASQKFEKIGILGTRTAMETRFYGAVTSAEVIPPRAKDLPEVHQAYVTMAESGVVTDAQRETFYAASRRLIDHQGVQAIMLGGTDLVLAFDGRNSDFPVIDCAGIHIEAIAKMAIE